jgi:DNA polymerase-3 subunit delta'
MVGHQKQLDFLEAARANGRMGHAYIFSGPEKIGKKTVAVEWVSRVVGMPLRQTSAHPDFLFLSSLFDSKTGKTAREITVDQIRGLIAKLALKPVRGKYKTAIIDRAELMNGEAQNCLLKTLEEPPGDAILILVASDATRLFETVRSRCQTVKFDFLPKSQMEELFRDWREKNKLGAAKIEDKEIIKLAAGRPGRLIDFLENKDEMEKWRAAAEEFARIAAGELPEKFAYAKKITDAENPEMDLNEIIEIWQYHFRNLLLELLKTTPVSGFERVGSFFEQKGSDPFREFELGKSKEKASGYSPVKIAAILKKIQTLDFELRATNASPRLSVENFLLGL